MGRGVMAADKRIAFSTIGLVLVTGLALALVLTLNIVFAFNMSVYVNGTDNGTYNVSVNVSDSVFNTSVVQADEKVSEDSNSTHVIASNVSESENVSNSTGAESVSLSLNESINILENVTADSILNGSVNVSEDDNMTVEVLTEIVDEINITFNNIQDNITSNDTAENTTINNSHENIAPEILTVLVTKKKHFDMNENPSFDFEYIDDEDSGSVKGKTLPISSVKPKKSTGKWVSDMETIDTSVYDSKGHQTDLKPEIEKVRDGKFSITLDKKRSFKPGKYRLEVQMVKDGVVYIEEQEFLWGLVSLNVRKSIYRPGETAEFVIVVLDGEGHPVCDADIDMVVSDSFGGIITYSTADGTVISGSECGLYGADYPAQYEGNHTIDITAMIDDAYVHFSTYFLVQQDYEFDVIRTAQSKIDPTKQDWFDVVIDIESFAGDDLLTVKEYVPVEFDVITDAGVEIAGDAKVLTWDMALADNKTSVNYSYSVPHVWPYLYALGSIEISYGSQVFTEARPWYVAVDPDYPATPTNSSDSEVSTTSTSYVTMKTISVTKSGETWIKSEHQLRASGSGKTANLRVQSVSDTGINCVNTTTSGTYVTFYCELDISSLSDGVQNFDLQLDRDVGQSYTVYNQNWRLYLEILLLKTNETSVNSSSVGINQLVCVNHTVTKKTYDIDSTWVEITYPNGTATNITTSNTTGDCGAGDSVYGVEINVGSAGGIFTVNTSWANDTNGGLDYDDSHPNLNVTVITPVPTSVIVNTYRNLDYNVTDKFFTINDTVFIEANVTSLAGNITDANVTADILNSTDDVIDTVNLTHMGGGSSVYRGNWTSDSTDNPGVYTVEANATNPYGFKIENNTFHLYPGENVSAYSIDWNADGNNDLVLENKHIIAVYDGEENTNQSMFYVVQKDTNVSYTFGGISDTNSLGKGEVTHENPGYLKMYGFSFTNTGENLASADMNLKVNLTKAITTEEIFTSYDPGSSYFAVTSGDYWIGEQFDTSAVHAGYVLSKVSVYINDLGSTAPLVVDIRAGTSTLPNTTVLATKSIAAANVSDSFGWYDAIFSNPITLSEGGNYWLVLRTSDAIGYGWMSATSAGYAGSFAHTTNQNEGGWTSNSGYDMSFKAYRSWTTETHTAFNTTIKMMDDNVDYLVYKLHNFDQNIENIGHIFSVISGTLGSSVSDDRYYLEDDTNGLVVSLINNTWNNYTSSNYTIIYDNSTASDSVSDNVIAWIRFNETENITFTDVGLWNDTIYNTEGFRIKYNAVSASPTDEINYILTFTVGGYDAVRRWMSTIESGTFPQPNIMSDIFPPEITVVDPSNNSNLLNAATWTWLNISTNEDAYCQWNDTASDFAYGTGTDFEVGQGSTAHAYNYTGITNNSAYDFWYKCNDGLGNINTEVAHHHFWNSDNISISLDTNSYSYSPGASGWISGTATYEGTDDGVPDKRVDIFINDSLVNLSSGREWSSNSDWLSGEYADNQTANNSDDELSLAHMMHPLVEINAVNPPYNYKNNLTVMAKREWGGGQWSTSYNGYYHDFDTPPETLNYTFYFIYTLFQTDQGALDRLSHIATFRNEDNDCNIFDIARYEADDHLYIWDGPCSPDLAESRNTAYRIDTGVVITDNTQYKVNVVFNDSVWKIYVNDVLEETIDNAANEGKNDKVWRITHSAHNSHNDYYETNITINYSIQYWPDGIYESNITEIDGAVLNVKPIWHADEPAGTDYTVFVSADNGDSWCNVTNNTRLDSGCGIGSGDSLKYRVNFSAGDIFQTTEIQNLTLEYEYGPKTDSDGFYNISFTAPPADGDYIIENNITDADGLTGENSTWILVSAPPTAGDIECNNSGVWGACNYSFYENITDIRVNCTPAAGKVIENATFLVTNTLDSETFLDVDNATSVSGDWWVYELNPEINVSDSGEWKITAQCVDNTSVSDSNQTVWDTAWGWLSVELVDPTTDANVSKDEFFTFESKVTCIGGECGSINATLDPEQTGDNIDSPIITYANLWPKSVVNGDTMHFDIRVIDDEGIVEITVDIGGIDTISLVLLEGTEYDGRWGGQWVVHDAKNQDYNATIRAVNNQGEYTEHILGWRDPLRIGDGIGAEVYDGGNFADLDEKILVAHDSIDGEMTFGDSSSPYGGWTAPGTATNIRNHITAGATAVYLGVVDYNSVNCNKTDGRNYGNVDYYNPDAADVSCWRSSQGNYFKIFTVTAHSFAGQWHFNGKVTDLDYASPEIESNQTYPYAPIAGDNITINVIVSDYNIPGVEWVNYTLKNPKGVNVIDNENGTFYYNSSLWTTYWNSSYYVIDMLGEWNVTVVAGDGDGNTTYSSWLFNVVDKFVIPTTVGATPFYTISDNPQSGSYAACLADMTLGDSCINNWTVNATGPSNTTWEFFVLYNATTYSGYFADNQTEKVNITIQDLIPPLITINLPENETYVTSSIWFNVTLNEAGDWCGYSLDGALNVTMEGSGTEWYKENATMTEGSHNVIFSCNDTSGNMNASVVTEYFTADTIPPQITILFPQNNSYDTQSIWFNATATDSQRPVDWCGYTLDHSTMPAWAIYWSYIRNITVNNTANSENLTDYQILVNLTTSNFDFTKANSDGNDTRFTWLNSTSGVEENISYWIESWDSVGEEAIVWVNIPFVNSTSYGYIYVYYGNTGADTDSNASGVFDWTLKGNFTISSSADIEVYPDIAFGNDTFLIAWHDYRSGTDWDVYAEMYNHTGGLSKDEFVIANAANDQTYPWVSFGDDKFFITWDDLRDGNWNYYAEMDNSTGDVSKDDFAVSTDAYPQGFGSTVFGDDRFFTIWYDKRLGDNTKYTVFGEIYNTTGDVSKDEFQISEESIIRTLSSMAFGSEKFLMVWQYENTTVRNIQAKTYNSTGDVVNDTFEVDAITLNIARPSSAFGNNRFFIAWIDNPSGDYNVYGKIYDQDFNTVKDTFMISTSCSLNSETSIVMYPSIAFGNGKFFITWHGGGSGDNNILAKIYDMDGTVIKDEFDISTISNNQENPSVAFGNGRFFIIWSDNRSGTNWDIYADLFKDTEYILTEPTITIGSEENTSVTMLNDTAIHFYAQNTSMTEGSHNVVFSCNDTVGNMNSTEAIEYFTVNTTDITYPQYSLNQTNSTEAGEDVLFSLYWTDNDLAGYIFSFDNCTGTFENDSHVGMTGTGNWSNVTKRINSTVGCTIQWKVYANDTAGNMNASEIFSFNAIGVSISVHEADNSTDKSWSMVSLPLDFSYYCYAGMGGCDNTYASDGDGSTSNFTIENKGDTIDVFVYVTSDFNSTTFMICSSTDSDLDGDDDACKDSPSTGENGADNLQVYINVSGSWGWYNVSNSGRDGTAYALAVDCDIPADTNASGIDFQVRAPYGTQGDYGTTINFVAYADLCNDGQEGLYFTP